MKSIFKSTLFISIMVMLFLVSGVAIADDGNNTKDWKLVSAIGVQVTKDGDTGDMVKSLVLTEEYDKYISDSSVFYVGADVEFAFEDKKTGITLFIGDEITISDVTTLDIRVDYDTKTKDATLLIRMIFTW